MSDRLAVMRDGHIQQLGRPRDIYDHPANRFVSHFIGDTNFLQAELLEKTDGRGKVRLSSGKVLDASLPAEGEVEVGKVSVVVRPEHTSIAAGGEQGVLSGRVENIVYFGTDTHFYLRLSDETQFMVRQQNRRDAGLSLALGDEAAILIGENALQVLTD